MSISVLSMLKNPQLHQKVLLLAIPMVISNITVPLLGLVDAAVIGHLEHSWYLGGVALGSTIISLVLWLFGFLRMSTTGLAAQSFGANDARQQALVFLQGGAMALLFAALFLVLHRYIADGVFSLSSASDEVKHYGLQYFVIRAWSAPAALLNYVILGWLLGTQDAKSPMWMVVVINITNIILDLTFVIGFGWKVEGAALASVIADYSGVMFGLICVARVWSKQNLPLPVTLLPYITDNIVRFIRLNRDIFLRSLCLQAAFAFMTFQGAAFGNDTVAANAVLMSFLMIISYAMDGFAYAIEAMVGKAIGEKNRASLVESLLMTFFWSLLICLGMTVIFAIFGAQMIAFITSIEEVRVLAEHYLPWLIAMPLVSVWCFLFDGIFIGATKGREMRNGMFLATSCFFIVFFLLQTLGNHALWAAMLSFMFVRGAGLATMFFVQWHQGRFLAQ